MLIAVNSTRNRIKRTSNEGITLASTIERHRSLSLFFQFPFSRFQASFSFASRFEMTRITRGRVGRNGAGSRGLCQDFQRTEEHRVEFRVRSRIVHSFLLRTPVTGMRNLIFRGPETEKRDDDKRTNVAPFHVAISKGFTGLS